MNRVLKLGLMLVACLLLAVGQISAQNIRLVRSAIFPGMGQLGDGQVGKGLLYMGGEAALLTLTFTNLAKHSAYVKSSVYDSVMIYNEGGVSEARQEIVARWHENVDNAAQTKNMTMAFGGAALVWWAWNVVDGLLFAPSATDELSRIEKLRRKTVVAVGPQQASVNYTLDF